MVKLAEPNASNDGSVSFRYDRAFCIQSRKPDSDSRKILYFSERILLKLEKSVAIIFVKLSQSCLGHVRSKRPILEGGLSGPSSKEFLSFRAELSYNLCRRKNALH